MKKHFVREKDTYKRNLDILKTYYHDSTTYLSKMTGKTYEECFAYVKNVTSKNGKFPMVDPDVLCLSRTKVGDREKAVMPFSEYLQDAIDSRDLVSPTFTTFLHPKKIKSLLALYIQGNLKARSKLKKESFVAKMAKKVLLFLLKNNQQNAKKIKNNALSGAHASSGTPLCNKSSHSVLTSVCRSATSYGNANNEKFISGNRHYWCPDVVKASIINICNVVDMDQLQRTMDKYGIRPPTVKETYDCIGYSTKLYWLNSEESKIIGRLISKLSDIERAAVVYVGDLYHLAKYNDSVVRCFMDKITFIPEQSINLDEAKSIISSMDSDAIAYISLLGKDFLKGITLQTALEEYQDLYCKIGTIGKNVISVLDDYQDLISALFVTDVMPTSIANLPNSIRRSAVVSDTDSTIFTVQEWGKWYTGSYNFSKESSAIAITITYLTSQAIIHLLAMMCVNMGVDKDDISKLQMKNEYAFPVFVLTPNAKHYFALISAQEGNVYEHMEKEVKGVGLRSSNCPAEIMNQVHELMDYIMNQTVNEKKISINYCYDVIAEAENKIRNSVETGKYEYLTKGRINGFNAYKQPNSSAYVYYDLWKDVFGDKYGHTEAPPYTAIKVSLNADNKTQLEDWFMSIEDVVIREKLRDWFAKRNKTSVTSVLLPESIVSVTGIPKEFIVGINIRQLIFDTVKPFYSVLESLGIFIIDDNISRLVSDTHKPRNK